jgi:hypothetical protein
VVHRVGDHVGDQPERWHGREYVGSPREVLLDDVVLGGTGQLRDVRALLLGRRQIEGQQPHRRSIDRHGRVHVLQRDAVEQGPHIADVGNRYAYLADFALRQLRVGVVTSLRG